MLVKQKFSCESSIHENRLDLSLAGEINLYTLPALKKELESRPQRISEITLDLDKIDLIDTAAAIYINSFRQSLQKKNILFSLTCKNPKLIETLKTVHVMHLDLEKLSYKEPSLIYKLGEDFIRRTIKFSEFLAFFGQIVYGFFYLLKNIRSLRYKEILFEINENAIKAFGIVAVTSFLVGVVTAYQSSVQLKLYGANIFIVDMLGISIFRELAPLLTAIVIAGRSGSSFTAQIGAMKITEELDAMRTMGFDPIRFLVIPRIIALMVMMPLLIFVSDISGLVGGMLIAKLDLAIPVSLFLDRLNEVVAAKHFFVGIAKGPFFAFLIASIGIFRGMMVKDDTQSIGVNTTKSVVEAIFAVIVCDAVFSIIFTNLGI